MDEILIGEKKYVSSKQAAKVTGYAKDYIGQLCREGRVPARLVGRSWYVLESAIHDHRFGKQGIRQDTPETGPVSTPTSAWESPHYEAFSSEVLPSVNRLRDTMGDESVSNDQHDVAQHLQDSWRAWFERVADVEPVALATLTAPEQEAEEKKPEIEEEEIDIPIHTVYELPPEILLPRHHVAVVGSLSDMPGVQIQREGRGVIRVIQVAGGVLAVLTAAIAVVGTGYFDEYILSNSQVGIIAGVSSYNK